MDIGRVNNIFFLTRCKMTTTEIVQKMPSCTINKNTIKKISELLDSEINKIPDEDTKYSKPEFDIRIESKRRTITIHNSNELQSQEIPRDLQSIRIDFRWYKEPEKRITIDLNFQWWDSPEIRISGTDPIWVNGILGQITDILIQNPTKNELVHNNSTRIPIFLGISVLYAIGHFFLIALIIPLETKDFTYVLGIPVLAIMAFFSGLVISFSVIPWFFPLVEFEGRGIQKKLRKTTLIIVGTVCIDNNSKRNL